VTRQQQRRITNLQIYEKVLEIKEEVVTLREYVNHRLSTFEERLAGSVRREELPEELARSFLARIARSPLARRMVLMIITALGGIFSYYTWWPPVEEALRRALGF
jgi:hypothetical protein